MSSILLSGLATSNNQTDLNSIYNSNIENKINQITKNNMSNNLSSEYLKQFDELSFDTITEPTSINDSHNTISGINSSLQRNLDFQNGYSQFQQTNMHYDVVGADQFVHNNMIPNTSRRDFDAKSEKGQRKLETFTGISDTYVSKKEKVPLFEPMSDLSWTTGMPTITSMVQNRYIVSNKNNNGNLPFQTNVRVIPGLEDKNQNGTYQVYRVNPRNIDELRSDINQKITYNNKPLETIKKGEIRAPDFNLTKYKIPGYREQTVEDLVPSRAVTDGNKQSGLYTNVTTQRNEIQTYIPGHSSNSNMGNGPAVAKTNFNQSKRESYLNDATHCIMEVTNKPVMTNINSFTNYDNQRISTNLAHEGHVTGSQGGNYTFDYKNIPLTTLRELMIQGDTNIGIVGSQNKNNYVFSNNMVLPQTIRESTAHNIISNATSQDKQAPIYNNDLAKQTVRENTSHHIITNVISQDKQGILLNNDLAKQTIRENTTHNIITNATSQDKQAPIYNNNLAKQTIRENTAHNIITNIISQDKQGILLNNDLAKQTTRETTSHNIITNAISQDKQGILINNDLAKQTIRENTSHNIITNAISQDKQGILLNNDLAKQTTRETTSHNIITNAMSRDKKNMIYNNDLAKPTIKQTTLINCRDSGNIGSSNIDASYARDINDIAKMTIRQQTENTNHIGTINSSNIDASYTRDINDTTRTTIRQQTENTNYIGTIGSTNIDASYTRDINNTTKPTIRQQTENNNHIGTINSSNIESTYTRDVYEVARPTIKQTTLITTPAGRINNSNMGNYSRDEKDEARATTKQTTILQNHVGSLHSEIEKTVSHHATDNMTIDERREILTYNRMTNGKKDLNGPYIDKDNVRLNEPILFSYVPHPHKPLDHTTMPTTTNEIISFYSMSKPVIETSSYYVNPYFINTLKNNPLVNDIYHQKNV